jgi:MFS family permease
MGVRFFPDPRGLPRAFAWLFVGTLVNRLGTFVMPFLAIYLTEQLHLSVERASLVVGLVGVGSIFAGPVGGALADRVGRRVTLIGSSVAGAVTMVALGFARDVTMIGAAAFALGFAGDLFRPALGALVADVVPEPQRARAYGLLHWAVNVGFAIGPATAGLLAAQSYTYLFLGDAATTLACGALVAAVVKETRPKPHADDERPSLFTPYRDPAFLAFVVLSLILELAFFQGFVALPLHMRAHGLSQQTYGLLLGLNGLLIVLFQPLLTSSVERLPRAHVITASALFTGIGWGMNELAGGTVWIYAIGITIWTAGEILLAPLRSTVVTDLSPPLLRGSYQGAFQLNFGLASALAPILGGVVLQNFGSAALWGGCAAAGLVSAVGFAIVVPLADKRRAR